MNLSSESQDFNDLVYKDERNIYAESQYKMVSKMHSQLNKSYLYLSRDIEILVNRVCFPTAELKTKKRMKI